MRKLSVLVIGLLFVFGFAINAYATNGMNMISYGGTASGMAGASLGISDDPSAMNNNPAGLTYVKTGEAGAGISLLMPNLTHKDFANDKEGESAIFPLPMMAYAHRVGKGPLVLGLGVFAQGGMGAEFTDLNTAFGTKDTTYSNVMYAKITPTVAYQVSDKVSLGLALNVGYSALEFKFFPETSYGMTFSGMDLKDASSFGYGAKLGVMIKPSDMVSLGIVYTSESKLDPGDGDLTLNMSSLGLGKVKYDADIEGFTWPQQLGFGVGIRPNKKLLIGVDLTWVNWSDAMDVMTVKASNPDNAMAPASMDIPFKMKWEDQWVFALGAAYKATDSLTVRAGYNYGKNPIPAETLSPLFPAIVEHHLTVGLGYTFGIWRIDGAWEYALNKEVTYTNPDAPFGTNAVEEHNQNTIHLFATYTF
ncbi:MAG: outer membrane protein transport protein [Nitrospirota bacterium]